MVSITTKCKNCDQLIRFITMQKGGTAFPVDVDYVYFNPKAPSEYFITRDGELKKGSRVPGKINKSIIEGYISHYETCTGMRNKAKVIWNDDFIEGEWGLHG